MSDAIKISNDFLRISQSPKGGFTKDQLKLIGVSWPPPKGWKKQVVGKELNPFVAFAFLHFHHPVCL